MKEFNKFSIVGNRWQGQTLQWRIRISIKFEENENKIFNFLSKIVTDCKF